MKRLAQIHTLSRSQLSNYSRYLPDTEPKLTGARIIPVCVPDISSREKLYVSKALSTSWISSAGDYVGKFEKAFASTISHTKFAYAVNSGTSALHLALAALGIGYGDEVIVPTFTMVATVNAVMYCGATPVFVDAEPETWNINTTQIESKITSKTKAIIVVHTYGAPVIMDQVLELSKKYSLWIVEDAAEAHGASYNGKRVGSIGDVGAFSMYANKTITTGEGGVVVTNNPEIAKRLKLLHNHAFSQERHFWHTMVGFGYRMTNLQAAVGLAQVGRFQHLFRKKRAHAALYEKLLSPIPGIRVPKTVTGSLHAHWMYGFLVDEKVYGMDKNHLRKLLAKHGIETRSFFIPIHIQPSYVARFGTGTYPVSLQLCRDGLYVPSSTLLKNSDIQFICDTIRDAALTA